MMIKFIFNIQMKDNQINPTKKYKKELSHPSMNQHNQQQTHIHCNHNGQKDIEEICGALISLQNYTKYISITIRHQEKSLSTLPPSIINLPQFSELKSRIQSTILRAKVNNEFLNKIMEGYSKQLLKQIHKDQKDLASLRPNLVIQSFILIAKQWSTNFEGWRKPIHKIVQLVNKYSGGVKCKIMVQGGGMGRILYELATQIHPVPQKIESIEDRPLHFLCGEFFVFKQHKETNKIYPFIHDFINHRTTQGPYSGLQVPSGLLKPFPSNLNQLILTNYGDFEQKYRSNDNNNQYNVIVSYLCTDRVMNMLEWLQIAYKMLVEGGIWVLSCFSSFERNIIEISYGQFREIVSKSQFKVLEQFGEQAFLHEEEETMVSQIAYINYLVLKK